MEKSKESSHPCKWKAVQVWHAKLIPPCRDVFWKDNIRKDPRCGFFYWPFTIDHSRSHHS